jgi:disulfide bond formation protein DsbB
MVGTTERHGRPPAKPRLHRARTACLWLALLAAWSLGFAYALQFGLGMRPCALCLQERYAFMALFLCGLTGFLFDYGRIGLIVCLGILVGLTGLTLYHVGVEFGWFQLSAACSGAGAAGDVDQLRAMLKTAGPTCDRPAWLIPGAVSLAQATAVWSILLTLLTLGFVTGPAFRR